MNRRGEIAWSTKRVSGRILALGKLGISGRSTASTRWESTGSGRVERTTTSTDPQSWHCRIGMYISEPEFSSSATWRTSPTTPTTCRSPFTQSPTIALPSGSWPGHSRRASVSLIMMTGVAPVTVSRSVKSRPFFRVMPHGLHIAVADHAHERGRILIVLVSLALRSRTPRSVVTERQNVRQTGSLHAGDGSHALQQFVEVGILLGLRFVLRSWIDAPRRRVLGPESGVHLQHAQEAPDQQPGAHQQHTREGDLGNHQRRPRPHLSLASAGSALAQ